MKKKLEYNELVKERNDLFSSLLYIYKALEAVEKGVLDWNTQQDLFYLCKGIFQRISTLEPIPLFESVARCIVFGCSNRKSQGTFVGDLCAPCYKYITTGEVGPTDSFLRKIKVLEKDVLEELRKITLKISNKE